MQENRDVDILAALLSRGKCDAANETKRKRGEGGTNSSSDDEERTN